VSSELVARSGKERTLLVTVPLLILHLALLSLQIERPAGTLVFKTWALAAQYPFIAVSSGVTNGIKHVWSNYIWLVGARSENEQLLQAVNRLSLINRSYEQIVQENERLRHLLFLNQAISYKTIGARVVARTPSYLSNVIYIDRGFNDGVRIDAPVISGDGIIGRTILVTKFQSQVQLITNPDASIGIIAGKNRTPGVLKGTGAQLLDLMYISNTEQIVNGDVILSSGMDGIFPKGLMIGNVVDSRKGTTVFMDIKVQPSMDFYRIEEVSVLLQETGDRSQESEKE
jgi:rod shape-determining protein MreC